MPESKHTLSLIADNEGQLAIHADAQGLAILIATLERIKRKVEAGSCEHDHFFSEAWGGYELSETKGCDEKDHIIHHVKIYGWTDEWILKHGFRNEK